MKRHFSFIIFICLLIAGSITAQLPKNRTTSTIIADALSQLPAANSDQYRELFAGLTATGEEGLMQLINRLNPAEKGSNAAIEFAIGGWTHFVASNEKLRLSSAKTFAAALQTNRDNYIRAFLIRQLEFIGGVESVATLSSFLNNDELAHPAAQALAALNNPTADSALLEALKQPASPTLQIALINAVGHTANPEAELELLNKLKQFDATSTEISLTSKTSAAIDKVILSALSKCGSKLSLPFVEKKVAEANYQYDNTNALASYILIIERVASLGDHKAAEKAAKQLMSSAAKAGNNEARIAALTLQMKLPQANQPGIVKKAMKDKDKTYVNQALSLYATPDAPTVQSIVDRLGKKEADVQEVVLYWLAASNRKEQLPIVLSYLSDKNPVLQTAAIRAATTLGGPDALKAIAGLLKSQDAKTLQTVETSLLSFKGEVAKAVVDVFDKSSEEGKLVALNVISNRKANEQAAFVMNLVEKGSPSVQQKSAAILRNVVSAGDVKTLIGMLEKKNQSFTTPIQEAISAGLATKPASEQLAIIRQHMKNSTSASLYYPLLTSTGSGEAVAQVAEAYRTTTGSDKESALKALKGVQNFESIYLLMNILNENLPADKTAEVVQSILRLIDNSGRTGEVRTVFLRELLSASHDNQQKRAIISRLGVAGTFQAMIAIAPYLDQQDLKEAACQAIINIALDRPQLAGTLTTQLLEKVMKEVNNPDAGYQRDAIRKYLTEHPVTGGYVSLFDGKSLAGWKGLVATPLKRATMSSAELKKAQEKANLEAAANWIVENGALYFTGKGDNLCTEKHYGDFEMLVDWKLYPGNEPDAGIYLRGTPQVQIWDTARVNVGAQVGSGGLYNNQNNPSKPLKVADLPVGTWNTFRIIMKGDRVTVHLNGELVTDNVILENYWDRKQPIFAMEQLELQAHGSRVAYRDIYIREISRPEPFKLPEEEANQGFEVLFDGTNMHSWIGNTTDYVTENGEIVLYPGSSYGGNLFTKKEYGNFIFRFEFQLTPGANNGLGIRTPMQGDPAYVGMELQILDDNAPIYSQLDDFQYHGSVYGIIAARRGHLKPVGEWNYQEVIADGDTIKITLNGTVIVEGNLREATKKGTLDGKEHPGLFNKKGHIGFLGHGSKVKFRNIRIKNLSL